MRHKPKHYTEYFFLRLTAGLLAVLPYRMALALGWGVAWIGFYLVRFRTKAAKARVKEIFGDSLSNKKVRRLVWLSWRNFIFSCIDLARIPVTTPAKLASMVAVEGVEKFQAHLAEGKGAIIATIHMGAWEMGALACLAYNVPLFSIAARQKNLLTDRFMNDLRAKSGFETILRDTNVAKGIIRRIRAGKVLAILPDVRSPTPAFAIDFLDKKANIAEGMGFIAHQTAVPIFPCVITRIGWRRHFYRVFDPVYPDLAAEKRSDALRMTQAVFDTFDKCVKAEPEQWFWFNKRWLFDPLKPR